ncbi:uncharacterized protein DUF2723 [Balneicella halophila]|uniref:Uncharacterized protein DUF2723 n=1 Tax=Balneicella halophila TaxID=1537566 RepID=A0A7L4UN65_BALHA|nr:DUF2723 domain-containing protein [Balneicella halophila]PVX50071.1 uncharacterized protein DUF2723 [Balneicella halophila]
MANFKRINTWSGWAIFAIALLTYFLTLAPSLSFWDCGEFIACADKLQVGHPPGAPLYLMLARLFAVFAPDTTQTALFVNSLSAVCSALTILFLFWTITHIARKLVQKTKEEALSLSQTTAIIGAGAVGALAFTFSDSFWFSAVEAEVYAMSSLFTAFVFWAILKWEEEADEPYANRWLVLIAYAMGLSLGVHLLNLLAIPAIVLVVYFKKYKFSYKGFLVAMLIAVAILGGILKIVLSGLLTVASWIELLFVNDFGWHYNSGLLFFVILLFAILAFGVYWTYKNGKPLWNTVILSFAVMLIGFSSYSMIIIRAHALTPMNNNEATNVFSLLSYLNREQYGQKPLFSGPYFNAPLVDGEDAIEIKGDVYSLWEGKYEKAYKEYDYNYNKKYTTIFPRMYGTDDIHRYGYEQWAGVNGNQTQPPTFAQNLRFFFSYQVNHMYWRYFMWNFSGRQNGVQGQGSLSEGNWITGIPFVDSMRLGKQSELPEFMKEDPSRNEYYMLPFILGLLGMFYQYSRGKKGKQSFAITFFLFFLTGLAIVLYVNQTPYQPRERDYSYVGSFYAFSIWIGLGVLAIWQLLAKYLKEETGAIVATVVCLALVPAIMAKENWDDHDRSGRYWARDVGQNYLMSANDENSIIFCYGDNDSFPLWYNQDVEGFRTDVRVANLSYLQSVWFIDQMKRQTYESLPMPISMTKDKYREGIRDQIMFVNSQQTEALERAGGVDLKTAIEFIKDDRYLVETVTGRKLGQFITNHFKLPVPKQTVIENGLVPKEYQDEIPEEVRWNLGEETSMMKQNLAIYDALAHNEWNRTFYFASTIGKGLMQGFDNNIMLTGLAYKLVPIQTNVGEMPLREVDTQTMYENVTKNFKWGNINDENVYLDETNLHAAHNTMNKISELADNFIYRDDYQKATEILDLIVEKFPYEKMRYFDSMGRTYRGFWIQLAQRYLIVGDQDKAKAILEKVTREVIAMQEYYTSMSASDQRQYGTELIRLSNTLEQLSTLYGSGEEIDEEVTTDETISQDE